MIIFGEKQNCQINAQTVEEIFVKANKAKIQFKSTSILDILSTLEKVGSLWNKGGKYYNKALEILPIELSFDKEMIASTLDLIPSLLDAKILRSRIELEIGNPNCLDEFTFQKEYKQLHKYESHGTLVHISAGNVFLGCIDSLIMGFLTKNINILKLSSQNQVFPSLFASSIIEADSENILSDKFAICYWKGGQEDIESQVKKLADGIICWGGYESVQNWKSNLIAGKKVFDYGPKISFGVITSDYLKNHKFDELADKLVQDISLWDQAACASCQVLYIQENAPIDEVIKSLKSSFEKYPLKRGIISGDEEVEVLKHFYRSLYHADKTNIYPVRGDDYCIVFDPDSTLSVSPLNRTIIIKKFTDINDLYQSVKNFSYNLQSVGLSCTDAQKLEYANSLSLAGITRITNAGKMLASEVGSPHDGRFGLSELVKIVSMDSSEDKLQSFLNNISEKFSLFTNLKNAPLEKWPFMDGQMIYEFGPGSHDEKLVDKSLSGYTFSSGGTTGYPKYSFYTYDEFEEVCSLLANSYLNLGLKTSDVVANLFVAANMWSSFSAVQKALELCKVRQLPIGGQCEGQFVEQYFRQFKPNVVFGIPSLLADLSKTITGRVDTIFYAGESLTSGQMQILKNNWNVKNFYSAGYASVDVGPIGYQDPNGGPGDHILFDGLYMEQIDGEAVITSTIRQAMPVIRYKTQDLIEIKENSDNKKFKILGRMDKTVFIWSARIPMTDIQKSLDSLGLPAPLQVQAIYNDVLQEDELKLVFDQSFNMDSINFAKVLHDNCSDLKQTVSLDKACKNISIEDRSHLYVNKRTGKSSEFADLR